MTRADLESLRTLAAKLEEELGARIDSGQLEGSLRFHVRDLRDAASVVELTCRDRLEDLAGVQVELPLEMNTP